MKIVIICAHFMPEVGYQEVHLATSFSCLGHEVEVITTKYISPSSLKVYKNKRRLDQSNYNGIKIHRLRSIFKWRSKVIGKGIKKKIISINPDIVIVIGVGKIFPFPVYSIKGQSFLTVTFFGENSDMKTKRSGMILKKLLYPYAVKKSSWIVTYTPSTFNIISSMLSPKLSKTLHVKSIKSSLGFDDEMFYFSNEERDLIREELGIGPQQLTFITVTRVTRPKKLESLVDSIYTLALSRNSVLHYIIVGILNDNYGLEFREQLKKYEKNISLHIYPFLEHNKVRALLNAADIGIWTQAAISIQEAMGTGIYILIPQRESVSHLIVNSLTGNFYKNNKDLNQIIGDIYTYNFSDIVNNRQIRANNNTSFSYEKIANDFLNKIIVLHT